MRLDVLVVVLDCFLGPLGRGNHELGSLCAHSFLLQSIVLLGMLLLWLLVLGIVRAHWMVG